MRSIPDSPLTYRPTALEMFLPTGASVFINFFGKDENLTVSRVGYHLTSWGRSIIFFFQSIS